MASDPIVLVLNRGLTTVENVGGMILISLHPQGKCSVPVAGALLLVAGALVSLAGALCLWQVLCGCCRWSVSVAGALWLVLCGKGIVKVP